jgi:hypothetical protein
MTAACYAAYSVGTALLITGHEMAHFAGAGLAPSNIVWAPSEAAFAEAHSSSQPTLVYYLDEFVPAVTGSVFFDPAMYTTDPSFHAVAAAWLGHVPADREDAVTLYPFYLATICSILAGLLALAVRRLPVFTFGMAIGLGGFYTVHHLVEAGLDMWQATLLGFLVLALYAVPAFVGFWLWCLRHVRPRPRIRTFRPNLPKVHGYTVMPAGGVQFIHLQSRQAPRRCEVRPQALMMRSAQHEAVGKPFSTKMAPMTASKAVANTDSRSLSARAPLPRSM